jgi:hypothetical protein
MLVGDRRYVRYRALCQASEGGEWIVEVASVRFEDIRE